MNSVIENIKARGLKDILNPKKWFVYLKSKYWKTKKYVKLEESEIFSYCEQVVYRSILCKPCVKDGKCKDCKCPVPENMIIPENTCSEKNWVEMKNSDEWNKYKKSLGIEFNIIIKPK